MKKNVLLSLIFAVCIIFGATAAVSAAETIDLLTPDYLAIPSGGTWEWVDGKLTCTNLDIGDTAMMSELFVDAGEHVVLELSAIVNEGKAWGIMIGEFDPTAPFLSWICVNMDLSRPSTRMFGTGVGAPYESEYINPDFTTGVEYTVALEINADNEFIRYFNGELQGVRENESWMGGYIGVMSWFGNVTYTNYTITYLEDGEKYEPVKKEMEVVLKPYDVRELELGEVKADLLNADTLATATGGEWTWADGKLTGNNAELGDTAIMSQFQVATGEHIYIELTGKVVAHPSHEGAAAFGIMFGLNGYETPFDNWMCLNAGAAALANSNRMGDTRIFLGGVKDEGKMYTTDIDTNKDVTLGLEITADGQFHCYLNGVYHHTTSSDTWAGGYLGIMTWCSASEFSSYKVYEVLSANQYTVDPNAKEEPVVEEPVVEEPVVEEPVVEEPVVEEPVVEAPVVEAPKTADAMVIISALTVLSTGAAIVLKRRNH